MKSVMVRFNTLVQGLFVVLSAIFLIGTWFELGFLVYFLYLLFLIGTVQVVMALIFLFSKAPKPGFLTGYLIMVVVYFAVFALMIQDMDESGDGFFSRYYIFPGSFFYTIAFWWYSFWPLRGK